jgi:hypothetical protein
MPIPIPISVKDQEAIGVRLPQQVTAVVEQGAVRNQGPPLGSVDRSVVIPSRTSSAEATIRQKRSATAAGGKEGNVGFRE